MRYAKLVILGALAGIGLIYTVHDLQARIRVMEQENRELRQLVEEQHQSTLNFMGYYRQRLDAIDLKRGKPVAGSDAIRNAQTVLLEDKRD